MSVQLSVPWTDTLLFPLRTVFIYYLFIINPYTKKQHTRSLYFVLMRVCMDQFVSSGFIYDRNVNVYQCC